MNPGSLGVLIPIFAILIGGLAIFTKSPLGHALADRVAGRSGASTDLEAEVRELRNEVETLRREIGETQERLDFTERLIASGSKGV